MILRAIVFFALFAVGLAGLPAHAADPVFPTGSPIGLVPPPGFEPSKRFPGFENADTSSSMVLGALPAQAFAEIEATMTAEAVKKQGIAEDAREILTLSHGKALLVAGTEEENGQKFRKWIFLATVPEGTALAAIRVPEAGWRVYPDDVIRASLLTLASRPTVPLEEQLSLMPFKFADLSGMRPIRMLGANGVFFTDGPKDSPDVSEQPLFVVSIGQGGPEQPNDRANFARNMFTGLADFKDIRILSGDMLRLGGGTMPTHELQAEATDTKTNIPVKLVQWVRFGSGVFIRMVGVARADAWTKAFTEFRTVRDGIGPKD
jgi:hypothetical protein